MDYKSVLDLLVPFTIRNEALEKLQSHVGSFNPLKVLRMDHYEIRHSNVLGWLLDPCGNHNLHDQFLKKWMIEVLLLPDNEQAKARIPDISESDFFLKHYMDIEVHREWNPKNKGNTSQSKRFIDVLLISHQHKLAIIIENKVRAGEGKDQLPDYYQMVKEKYDNYTILPIYLTLFGDAPSDERYFSFSHFDLFLLLNRFISSQADSMNQKVYLFIQDYLKILEELTLPEKQYQELCEDLYLRHKTAIETIIGMDLGAIKLEEEYAKETYELVRRHKEVSHYIKNNGEIDHFKAASKKFEFAHSELKLSGNLGKNSIWFYPVTYDTVPGFSECTHPNYQRFCPYAVPYIFGRNTKTGNIELKIEIGECVEEFSSRRTDFIHLVSQEANSKINPTKKITQFKKVSRPMAEADWENEEAILKKMNELYSCFQDFYPVVWSCIQNFDWQMRI
ncbi:PD-(D/E)XK nuclease family protein [Brevibacillus centrosporus]|uniref:PDDEXK-like family protein n=1 Tax=Brevibacillus centrosporus TaxID=54910 RepID=UPI002E1D2218|nr:PD-(D/E)XK nuclease family protein [Brevibacillus centrosporus]